MQKRGKTPKARTRSIGGTDSYFNNWIILFFLDPKSIPFPICQPVCFCRSRNHMAVLIKFDSDDSDDSFGNLTSHHF